MKKQIWLPASQPADGQHGAHVVVVVDPAVDTLLHLHERSKWTAAKGAAGNPAEGSGGPKRRQGTAQTRARPLQVPVPPGTVVRDTRGRVLAELTQVGERYVVCEGGQGGRGAVAPRIERQRERVTRRQRALESDGVEVVEVADENWKEDTRGGAGEERKVVLQLRVVADAGFVGLPNVGKSSLLRSITAARAQVADYPFTTLMPNLGVMTTGGDAAFGAEGRRDVLVDLPGLIEGAHTGRGLGRMFLRHLARTRAMVHVVDASADSPGADYWVVREELRMYNPDYCVRPHVVALNKMDLPDADELRDEVESEIGVIAAQLQAEHPGVHVPPAAIVCCSAATGDGIDALVQAVASVLRAADEAALADDLRDVLDWDTSLPAEDGRFQVAGSTSRESKTVSSRKDSTSVASASPWW